MNFSLNGWRGKAIINLFSYCGETTKADSLVSFNEVVAWSLKKAFTKRGVEARLVADRVFWKSDIPMADYSLVISNFVMRTIRDDTTYRKKVRAATKVKTALYLETDILHWEKVFDYVFTVVSPNKKPPQYVYAGWGANPQLFYPEQGERAIFLDSLMYGYYGEQHDDVYNLIKDVFDLPSENFETGKSLVHQTTVNGKPITVYMPLPVYRKGRVPWSMMQAIFRKCHFYMCTQRGECGLTRLESATSGGLLLVPEMLYRPRTMDSLEHIRWQTKQELIDALEVKTNPDEIRRRALEHSWDKVVARMLPYLGGVNV